MKAARFFAVLALMVGIAFGQSCSRSRSRSACDGLNCKHCCINDQCRGQDECSSMGMKCEHCCINGQCGTSDECNPTIRVVIIAVPVVGALLITGLVYYCCRRGCSQQPQTVPVQNVVVQPSQNQQYPPPPPDQQQMQQYPPGYNYVVGAPTAAPQQPYYGAPGQSVYGQTSV